MNIDQFVADNWWIGLLLALATPLIICIRAALILASTQDKEYQRLGRKNRLKKQHYRNW